MGFFKNLFFGMSLQRKVKECDRQILNQLHAFRVCHQFTIRVACLNCSLQATLAFDERSSHCAEIIKVRIPPVLVMVVNWRI
jgi:hypothetical protein